MADTVYIDISGTYDETKDGSDSGANLAYGLGAIVNWLRGHGAFVGNSIGPGDKMLLKGTAEMAKFVQMDCGKDVSAWSLGDAVRNDTGNGDHWVGVLVEVNDGATDLIIVQLTTGDYDDVNDNLGDGIENTDAADTTSLDAVAFKPWCPEGYDGDTTDGDIKMYGCDAVVALGGRGSRAGRLRCGECRRDSGDLLRKPGCGRK